MGLLKKYDQLKDSVKEKIRDAQDKAESVIGSATRSATGQGQAASNKDGLDVFASFLERHTNAEWEYRARDETSLGAGWLLHNNKLGPKVNDDDITRGGQRFELIAYTKPMGSLAEFEVLARASGNDPQRWQWSGHEVHGYREHDAGERTHSMTFLFQRLVVRARFRGNSTADMTQWWAQRLYYELAENPAPVNEWQEAHGHLAGPLPLLPGGKPDGVFTVDRTKATLPTPVEPAYSIPAAAACSSPSDEPWIMRDWDGWESCERSMRVGGDWTNGERFHTTGPDCEGFVFTSPSSWWAQVMAIAEHVPMKDLARARACVNDAVDREPPFPGVGLLVVGHDHEGYGTAVVVINDLAFFTRVINPPPGANELDLAHALACEALEALPE